MNQKMKIKYIVTHPGRAHLDDFLSCCVLISETNDCPAIYRRDPTATELDDPEIAVVDIGGVHDPRKLNFDHHHFPRDHEPTCSLSLVLDHLGLYEDALTSLSWLRVTEVMDSKGPTAGREYIGVTREQMSMLANPIVRSMLDMFAEGLDLRRIMKSIGVDLITKIQTDEEHLEKLDDCVRFLDVDTIRVAWTDEPDCRVGWWLDQRKYECQVFIKPDDRGSGYALYRYDDAPGINFSRVDFSKIEDHELVTFAHKNGFVAKVSTRDQETIEDLIRLAAV